MYQDGLLIINKRAGMTSHDVVQRLRRVYGIKKVGHTGTLDPMVEGVMVIAFGRATKLVQFLLTAAKTYRVTVQLGLATDTEDVTGTVIEQQQLSVPTSEVLREQIPLVLESFIGSYQQIPPMYSAIKVQGKKLYEYARENREIKRESRNIDVFSVRYDATSYTYVQARKAAYFTFDVKASKGLYARTLCVDIGKKLAVPATMAALTRLQSGAYTLEQASELEQVLRTKPPLIPLKDIQLGLPRAFVAADVALKLRQGYKLPHHFMERVFVSGERFAVYDKMDGALIGIYQQSEKYADKYQSVRII